MSVSGGLMIHKYSCFLLISLSLISPGCSKTPALGDEIKSFQGWWQIAGPTPGNKLARFEKDIFQVFEVKGSETKAVEKYQFRVNQAEMPAQIDFVCLVGEHIGKTRPGIFVFEDKKLKICLAHGEPIRPSDFAATDKTILMVLEPTRDR